MSVRLSAGGAAVRPAAASFEFRKASIGLWMAVDCCETGTGGQTGFTNDQSAGRDVADGSSARTCGDRPPTIERDIRHNQPTRRPVILTGHRRFSAGGMPVLSSIEKSKKNAGSQAVGGAFVNTAFYSPSRPMPRQG